jgi:hypothetical protein
MGTWGYGIFDDDFTLDIKDYYRQYKNEGIHADQCISRIKRIYSDAMDDPDLEPLFYLGLAATLCEFGELKEDIKKETLQQIIRDGGLLRWRDAGLIPYWRRKYILSRFCRALRKQECLASCSTVDEEDLSSDRFHPEKQVYHVYELTFSSGKRFIGSTVHLEERKKYFERNPLK